MADERLPTLLVEARRQRCMWIESSRGGSGGAGFRGGSATAADSRRLSVTSSSSPPTSSGSSSTQYLEGSPVAEILPSALRALDYLSHQLEVHGELDVGYDAPASMQSSDIPYPTHDGMPGASAYDVLLAKLKHPSAAEIVYLLKGFVSKMERLSADDIAARVSSEVAAERPSQLIHSFLFSRLAPKMRSCPLWCHASEPPDIWAQTQVAIESFVHHKIAHIIFGISAATGGPAVAAGPAGEASDEAFAARIDALGFVDAEHLDIKSLRVGEGQESQVVQWDSAIDKLRRMSAEFGPSAKIDMVVACSREITKVLTKALNGKLPGADDFLPAMILVVRKANPPRLLSNLSFIQVTGSLLFSIPNERNIFFPALLSVNNESIHSFLPRSLLLPFPRVGILPPVTSHGRTWLHIYAPCIGGCVSPGPGCRAAVHKPR